MNQTFIALALGCFSAVSMTIGCGDASAPRIDGPGAHAQNGETADAAPDHGNGFQDPAKTDGGCEAPNLVCSGVCTTTDQDPQNCGACGNACIGGDAICLAGKCSCGGTLMDYCDGVGCMDVSSDFDNCGSCGYACDPNNDQSCSQGNCVPNDP